MLFIDCCCSYCYLRVVGVVFCVCVVVCSLLGLCGVFCFRFVVGRWSLLVVIEYCMLFVVCCLLFVVFC